MGLYTHLVPLGIEGGTGQFATCSLREDDSCRQLGFTGVRVSCPIIHFSAASTSQLRCYLAKQLYEGHRPGCEIKASDMNYATQVSWKYSGSNCCTTGPVCQGFVKLTIAPHLPNEQKKFKRLTFSTIQLCLCLQDV